MYKKNFFNFAKFDKEYLLTNEFGFNIFLSDKNFKKLINNEDLPRKIAKELDFRKFIYFESDEDFVQINYDKLRNIKDYLNYSTTLHIFVVSKNCNYNCIYCQAGNLNNERDCLMDLETAEKAVDIALQTKAKCVSFEFQGGEPLTNFDIIKHIVEYSQNKNESLNEEHKKEITYNIVSNLSLLDDNMIELIKQNDIFICTSIDGDRILQNTNRPYTNGDSYDATINSLKQLQHYHVNVSALLTTTKFSFSNYKSIVDEYVKLHLDRVCIRPLTNICKANSNWEKIGYTPEEFIKFYKNALDYIIKINKKGYRLVEGMASIFLSKILNNDAVNYMELRSPCGAAIGQMAYYYDGNIFTCDEGRMLYEMGDDKFLIGNVNNSTHEELINCEKTNEICKASCLECSHICHSCVYMPYCGTCPVINYSVTKQMAPYGKDDYRCRINKGILDTLFSYIKNDKRALKIFYTWI